MWCQSFFCVQTWRNTCVSLYLWAYSLCNLPFKGIIKIARPAVWKWKKNNIYDECKVNNWQVQSTLLHSFVCVLFCVGATAISLAHILRLLTSFASYWFSSFIDKRLQVYKACVCVCDWKGNPLTNKID